MWTGQWPYVPFEETWIAVQKQTLSVILERGFVNQTSCLHLLTEFAFVYRPSPCWEFLLEGPRLLLQKGAQTAAFEQEGPYPDLIIC